MVEWRCSAAHSLPWHWVEVHCQYQAFAGLPRSPLGNRLARLQSRFEVKNPCPYPVRTPNSAASSYHYIEFAAVALTLEVFLCHMSFFSYYYVSQVAVIAKNVL